MIEFQGFKPEAMPKIASSLGYEGDMDGFQSYLDENPDKQETYASYLDAADQMASGGFVQNMAGGGTPAPAVLAQQTIPTQKQLKSTDNVANAMVNMATSPGLPTGSIVVPVGTQVDNSQLINLQSGKVTGKAQVPTAMASINTAEAVDANQIANQVPVEQTLGFTPVIEGEAQTGQITQQDLLDPAQMDAADISQLNLETATGTATQIDPNNMPVRTLDQDEIISGSTVDQQAVEDIFGDQPLKAATVADEMGNLMNQFQGGNTPAWAAGAVRNATAQLAARGLAGSSMAGMAIVQAAMESALPIAQMDAANKQQVAMESAKQRANFLNMEYTQEFEAKVKNAARVSEIANMNFTAEQQVVLENAKMAQTMNLANLSATNAKIMADAATMSALDMENLDNRQQAAVQTAQAFLQMDMTNLSNEQQIEMFNAQTRAQALFSDAAAINAGNQFNASSQNQVDQFFANLKTQNDQFNASATNAQAQFNAGQENVVERFNTEINNQRDQFNAQNRLIIDQNNATWRREIATADTAAVNRANEINAAALLGISQSAYNNLWQGYADNMEWAWTSAENEQKRINDLAMVKLQADSNFDAIKFKSDADASSGFGAFVGSLFTSNLDNTIAGGILRGIGLI